MPRRSQKILYNTKPINSSISQTNQLIQLHINEYDQTQNNIISRIESIGNLIIDELKGSERKNLKEQLLKIKYNNLSFCSSKQNLKRILTDLYTFDCHIQRKYSTIGIGDNDVNINTSIINIDKLNETINQCQNTNMLNDDIQLSTASKRKLRQKSSLNSSQTIENETKKKIPKIITRTICTRSSKLNTLNNNNQEQSNNLITTRESKRRSSSKTTND